MRRAASAEESPTIQSEAKAAEVRCDELKVHDNQFDLSAALISIALSLGRRWQR